MACRLKLLPRPFHIFCRLKLLPRPFKHRHDAVVGSDKQNGICTHSKTSSRSNRRRRRRRPGYILTSIIESHANHSRREMDYARGTIPYNQSERVNCAQKRRCHRQNCILVIGTG